MAFPYISDSDLKTALAGHLKLASIADIPPSALVLLTPSNQSGYDEIQSRLIGRGFTQAQIDAWDRRVEFNRDIALFWLLVHAANLTADDLWVSKLDRRAELDTVVVTNGGAVIVPSAAGGGFLAGRLNRDDQLVVAHGGRTTDPPVTEW